MKRYKLNEWDILDPYNWDFETRTYVDKRGKPITGILEDFFYFEKDDPRNHVEVKDGKRV